MGENVYQNRTSTMKILVVANKPPYPPVDGGTLATLNLCMGLAKAGNNVAVLALSTPKHLGSIDRIPFEVRSYITFDFFHIHLSSSTFKNLLNLTFTRKPYNIQRYYSTGFKRLLTRTLRDKDFDVVQLEGLYLVPYIGTIRKAFNGKLVMRAHNIENHIWENLARDEESKIRQWYFKVLARRLASIENNINKKVDALVAISNPDREWFLGHGFVKPSIAIPAGYFPGNQASDVEKPDNPSVCYIGALDWLPNTEGLLWFLDWVWPRIQSEIPNVEIHIAGRNAPEEFAERLMMERSIIFHGQVANSAEFLGKFSVMIVPLLSGSGIRVKIIEGMFLKHAIVSTSMAAKGIDANHGEHILIADTPEEFAKAVCSLIKLPEMAGRIAQNAQTFALENYDAVNLASKLTGFYKEISQ